MPTPLHPSIVCTTGSAFDLSKKKKKKKKKKKRREMVEKVSERKWTKLEDLMLAFYIAMHGAGNWDTMACELDIGRSGISCRHRWNTKLSPAITNEEIQGAAGGWGGAPSGNSDALLKELEAFLMSDG